MNKRSVFWIGIILVSSATLGSALFGCAKKEPEVIKVGAIMPLTGELATYGIPVKQGMEFALEEINKAGGVKGTPLRIIFEDDHGDPKTAVSAFNKLIDADKVQIILGPLTSGASMATAPVAERRKVVQLSTLAGTVELKYAGDYVFRVFASNEYQSKSVANKAIDVFGSKRAAILYINNAYGQGSKQIVEKQYKERGGKIVAIETFNEGQTDFRAQLTKIKATKPDLIFGLTYWKEGALVLRQAKNLTISVPILGEDAWYGPIEETAGDAVKLLVFSSMAFGEQYKKHQRMQQFIRAYKERFGKEADSYSATGYDAVYLTKHAIEMGGYNADAIKTALYKTKDFIGALGKITFDEYGDNVGAEFDLYVIRNGKSLRYLDAIKEEGKRR